MAITNELRAFYNASFDNHMTKFCNAYTLRKQLKRIRPAPKSFEMTTKFNLPSIELVLQDKPNEAATALNLELMNYKDELPADSDSNSNSLTI